MLLPLLLLILSIITYTYHHLLEQKVRALQEQLITKQDSHKAIQIRYYPLG